MIKIKNNKGFSLLELLLYVSLAGTILLTVSLFFVSTLQSRVKNQTIAEVEQQGILVMEKISQEIRNANSLDSPSQGTSSDILRLNGGGTVFDLSEGSIRIDQGSPINLTSSRIVASNLVFYNLSYTDTPGVIRIQFTLSHINPGNKNEYNYSKTFYASANLYDV